MKFNFTRYQKMFIPFLMSCLAMGYCLSASAQTISIGHGTPGLQTNKTYASGATVAFPATGFGPSTITFTITNTGGSTLNLTGTPMVAKSGANAADFTVTQPATGSFAPGGSLPFTVTYNPSLTTVETAQLTIVSNSTTNSTFVINLKGPGKLLYGALFPPYGAYTFSATGSGMGRSGGLTYNFSNIALAGRTTTYWGASDSVNGNLAQRVSLDDNNFTGREWLTLSTVNLASGTVEWTGNTTIPSNCGTSTVYLRSVLQVNTPAVLPLVDPATIGLSEEVGGLVAVTNATTAFNATYTMYASFNPGGPWTPYLDFYDNYTANTGGCVKSCAPCAYISHSSGFYWNDLAPKFTTNNPLSVLEGGTATIAAPTHINLTDDEELPAFPQNITFNFNSSGPLNFNTGVLKKSGVAMTAASTFTLQDLQLGNITFTHDGSETIYDEFQFSAKDSKGVFMNDGNPANTNFTFRINITPVNDAPTTRDTTFTTSYTQSITRNLVGYDTDVPANTLTYSIVSGPNPAKGNITGFNSATGQFTYNPTFGSPTTDAFTFRVNDGTVFSNTSTVTINQVNLPPTTSNINVVTREDVAVSGAVTGVDPEGSAVTFVKIKDPLKGTVTFASNGSFTYTPGLSKFGADYFTFKAQDAQSTLSPEDTVFIRIIPRLDPGDVLVMDKNLIRLYDPLTAQDTVITRNQGLSEGKNLVYKKGTSIFFFDGVNGLVKANPLSGAQSLVAPLSGFSGCGPIGAPVGMLIDNTGKIVVANCNIGILSVDSTSGAITTMFTGGNLQFSTGVVYLANGDLLVTDAGALGGGSSKIIRITPAGVQSIVSAGGFITLPLDIALIDQNTAVISDAGAFAGGTDRVYKIDLTTGLQTLVSTGGNISVPSGLDYRAGKLYVANNGSQKVLDVNPTTGTQTILPGSAVDEPWGLMIVPDPIAITNTSSTNETCAGSNNGTATVTFNGGTAPYSYTVDGGTAVTGITSPVTVNNLAPGSHTIIIYDNAGATANTTVLIGAGYPLPTVNAVANQTVCNNSPTAAINFSGNISGTICGTANEGGNVVLTAPAGAVITGITFASYGTPNGSCGNFTLGGCHAANSMSIVSAMAVGQNSVSIPASNGLFGDPCAFVGKRLYIQATYSATPGEVFSWTNNTTSIGLAASGTGNIGSFTATNSGTAPVTATITVTPSYTNGGTSCTGSAMTFTYTVNPTPVPVIVSNGPTTICTTGSVILSTGNALTFNGTNDVQVNGSTIPVGNSPYTIEAWVKPTSAPGISGIVGWGNYGTTSQVNAFRFNGPTQLVNYWWANDLVVNIPNVMDGNWHHMVATFDGTTRSIYSDGVLRGQDNPTGHNVTGSANFTIAKTVNSEFFNGSIDEVRIWNTGRSQAQIIANMNSTIPVASPGLTAYYKLDEGTGTTTADATGNGNTGTLFNSPVWMVPSTSPIAAYSSYLWSPGGETTPTITVTAGGTYSVQVQPHPVVRVLQHL